MKFCFLSGAYTVMLVGGLIDILENDHQKMYIYSQDQDEVSGSRVPCRYLLHCVIR